MSTPATFGLALASNVVVATLLATLAAVCLRRERPGLAHGLSVLGLLKLVTPPLWRVPFFHVPTSPAPEPAAAADLAADLTALLTEPSPVVAPPSTALSPLAWCALVSATGSLLLLARAAARTRRFQRLLRLAEPASRGLHARACSLAGRLQLRRCPPVLVVAARVSPMLCVRRGRAHILLPAGLLRTTAPAQLDALLAHELAHAARRDHWVRLLELAVACALWWLPTTWWLRRTLRRAEERCCDAHALRALPEQARTYADALLTTLDFLAGTATATPNVACGVSTFDDMKTRLHSIMSDSRSAPLPSTLRALLFAGAAAVLPLAPSVAQEAEVHTDSKVRAELRAAQEELQVLRDELTQLRADLHRERSQAHAAQATTHAAGAAQDDGPLARLLAERASDHAQAKAEHAQGRKAVLDALRAYEEAKTTAGQFGRRAAHAADQGASAARDEAVRALELAQKGAAEAVERAAAARTEARDALEAARVAATQSLDAARAGLARAAEDRIAVEKAHDQELFEEVQGEPARVSEEVSVRGQTTAAPPTADGLQELRQQLRQLQRQLDQMARKLEGRAAGGEAAAAHGRTDGSR